MQVTRKTLIGEILAEDSTAAQYFYAMGMGCIGCPSAQSESVEEACAVHDIDPDALIEMLNQHLLQR